MHGASNGWSRQPDSTILDRRRISAAHRRPANPAPLAFRHAHPL